MTPHEGRISISSAYFEAENRGESPVRLIFTFFLRRDSLHFGLKLDTLSMRLALDFDEC